MADVKIPTDFERAQTGLGGPENFGAEQWANMNDSQRKALILVLATVLDRQGLGQGPDSEGRPFWKGPQTASRPVAKSPSKKKTPIKRVSTAADDLDSVWDINRETAF